MTRVHALTVLATVLLVGCGAPAPGPAVTPPAGPETYYAPPPTEVTVEDPPQRNEDGDLLRFTDGSWTAGSDIAAGFYRSTGLADGRALCSWSVATEFDPRRGRSSGTAGVTIASGVANGPDEPQRVALVEGQQITTAGCDTWVYYGP